MKKPSKEFKMKCRTIFFCRDSLSDSHIKNAKNNHRRSQGKIENDSQFSFQHENIKYTMLFVQSDEKMKIYIARHFSLLIFMLVQSGQRNSCIDEIPQIFKSDILLMRNREIVHY